MRYTSKKALVDDIRTSHDSLCARLREIPSSRYRERGVWGDGWSVSDLVAHLAEWQFMFLAWYEDGLKGATPRLPAPGYTWRETPRLNRAIWEKHRLRAPALVRDDFDAGHRRILEIIEGLSADELLTPGRFAWTGKHPLATYLGPNTASHYRFAVKVIRRWLLHGAAHRAPAVPPDEPARPTKARAGASRKKGGRPRRQRGIPPR